MHLTTTTTTTTAFFSVLSEFTVSCWAEGGGDPGPQVWSLVTDYQGAVLLYLSSSITQNTSVSDIGMVVLIGKWNLSGLLLINQIVEPQRFGQFFQEYCCGTNQGQKKENQTLCTHAVEGEGAPGQRAGLPGVRLPYWPPRHSRHVALIYSTLVTSVFLLVCSKPKHHQVQK